MLYAARIPLILLLVALVPVRGIAAATVGLCGGQHGDVETAMTQAQSTAAEQGASHDKHGVSNAADDEPKDSSRCVVCAEHCSGSSYASLQPRSEWLPHSGPLPVGLADLRPDDYTPPQADRPPLAP